jgi:hypothetical protein
LFQWNFSLYVYNENYAACVFTGTSGFLQEIRSLILMMK